MKKFDGNTLISAIKDRILEIDQMHIDLKISNFEIKQWEEGMYSDAANSIVTRLSYHIAKEDHIFNGSLVPVTWWDHFKRDALPKWLQAFFPYEEHYQSTPITVKFPGIKLSSNDIIQGRMIIRKFETYGNDPIF